MSTTPSHPRPPINEFQWRDECIRRFGPDPKKWRFVCPICNGEQTPEDFRPYKDKGATPDSVVKECLGLYQKGARRAFSNERKKPTAETRCDYAAYGLFRVGVVQVDGYDFPLFDWATPPEIQTRKP